MDLSMQSIVQIALTFTTTVHFVLACVMSVYARHRVQYLCLAAVNAIFFFIALGACFFSARIAMGHPGVLHPLMIISLVVTCFLQSIYPLSVSMPGYLQWGRMWKYATPAIILIIVYIPMLIFSDDLQVIPSTRGIVQSIYRSDMLLRIAALFLCLYYIINIFRLPHKIARSANVPQYLFGYCTALGLLAVFYYIAVCAFYHPVRLMIYLVLFSAANMFLVFRELETIAHNMPKPNPKRIPQVTPVATSATTPSKDKEKEESDDFNQANILRFQRTHQWMETHKEAWKDNSFGRDRLCAEVGYNRHLLLQCIRSQGYNNVHDYINSFRVAEIKLLVANGRITSAADCLAVGFGTVVTARTTFEKFEDINLDLYIDRTIQAQRQQLANALLEAQDN